MRIVYLNPSGELGGAETSLLSLMAGIRRHVPEWEITLILGEDGPLGDRARQLTSEVRVIHFPQAFSQLGDSRLTTWNTSWYDRIATSLAAAGATVGLSRYVGRLRSALNKCQPDLIHTNGYKMHILGLWARADSVPVIWHLHDYVRQRPLMRKLVRRYSCRCAAIIANSFSVAEDLKDVAKPGPEITTIYNSLDLDRFSPAGPHLDLDAICGMPPVRQGTVRIGFVATFARWKGHMTFLQALSLLPVEIPVRAYIVGGPVYRTAGSQFTMEELRREVDRLKISDRVGFAGFLSDPATAMRSVDILVHASTQPEPFGMVIVEGMACGKPVIASNAGGAAEIIQDGRNALAHSPGNAKVLAQQMAALAGDPSLRRRLGEAGLSFARTACDPHRQAREITALYERCLLGQERLGSKNRATSCTA